MYLCVVSLYSKSLIIGSDSCSEHSTGGVVGGDVNTLLSGAGHVNKALNKIKLPNDCMRIDMCTFDPDTLWHRPPARCVHYSSCFIFQSFHAYTYYNIYKYIHICNIF